MMQPHAAFVREIPEAVRDVLVGLGIPADDVPGAVSVELFDQALLLAQYRLVDLSMSAPYVHRVVSVPFSRGHDVIASILTAALSSSRLSRSALFQLTYGTHTVEFCQGEILVRPATSSEGKVLFSVPL